MNSIPISETFYSIQGEGKFAGAPSFFIRTSGCNLRCWWCDTPYTSWRPEGKITPVQELLALVNASPARHVVITGGEPMLFSDPLAELVSAMDSRIVTIETNGTIFDERVQPDLWSVSPKLLSAQPSQTQGSDERAIHKRGQDLSKLQEFCGDSFVQYKFVITTPTDIAEVQELVQKNYLPKETVWLMPEGHTRESVLDKAGWIAEECKRLGYNLALRGHMLMWGNRRGV